MEATLEASLLASMLRGVQDIFPVQFCHHILIVLYSFLMCKLRYLCSLEETLKDIQLQIFRQAIQPRHVLK